MTNIVLYSLIQCHEITYDFVLQYINKTELTFCVWRVRICIICNNIFKSNNTAIKRQLPSDRNVVTSLCFFFLPLKMVHWSKIKWIRIVLFKIKFKIRFDMCYIEVMMTYIFCRSFEDDRWKMRREVKFLKICAAFLNSLWRKKWRSH